MVTSAGTLRRTSARIARAVDERLAIATAAGKARDDRGEIAVSADYDAGRKRLHVELASGVAVSIPVARVQGLADAPAAVIKTVRIEGRGYGLYWSSLDLDVAVPDLIAGCFGSRAWMSALARQGGKATTTAKRRAARENGRKGGRPRRQTATVGAPTKPPSHAALRRAR
jgi:hypothetical protein